MAKTRSKAAYMISAVAEQYGIHPQTLRLYEREGLLAPSRSEGNTRLYTDEDLERLEVILHLTRDLGVNLAGVEIILNMREKMAAMQQQMEEFVATLNTELAARGKPAPENRACLIPVVNCSRPPHAKPPTAEWPQRSRCGWLRSSHGRGPAPPERLLEYSLMVRFAAFVLFVPALCAQLNSDVLDKAPPDVEDALRARMTQFFQLHVEGKYRQAEKLVAEETMDYYYNASKPKYLKFAIGKIQYSDNFTKAFSTVLCSMNVPFPGLAGKPLEVPTPSWWKLENGQWFWYIPQEKLLQTPFGTRKPESGEPAPAASGSALPAKIPATLGEAQGLLNGVQADKTSVRLNSAKPSSDQIVIENRLAGVVKLVLSAPKVAGLEARLERQELKPGEKTSLTFSYKPGKKAPERAAATVNVEPTNQAIPVEILFAK